MEKCEFHIVNKFKIHWCIAKNINFEINNLSNKFLLCAKGKKKSLYQNSITECLLRKRQTVRRSSLYNWSTTQGRRKVWGLRDWSSPHFGRLLNPIPIMGEGADYAYLIRLSKDLWLQMDGIAMKCWFFKRASGRMNFPLQK